jgi:hypothetical protein
MRFALWLSVCALLIVVAGAALFVVSLKHVPELPEYPADMSLEDLMAAEFERLKGLHESGRTGHLDPRVKAIVDDFDDIPNPIELQKRVARALYEIKRRHAQAFSDRHPGLLEQRRHVTSETGREYEDEHTAGIPHALGTDEQWGAVMARFPGWTDAMSGSDWLAKLDVKTIAADPAMYEEFLEESAAVEETLRAVLLKPDVLHARSGVDLEDPLAFPLPVPFREVVLGRIQVLLALGKNEHAVSLIFSFLSLLERADLIASYWGLIFLVVYSSNLIEYAIVPCAQFGAMTPDRLDALANRGRRLPINSALALVDSADFEILAYLGPTWQKQDAGSLGLPRKALQRHGPQPVDRWLTLLDSQWSGDIQKYVNVRKGLLSGSSEPHTEEMLHAFLTLVSDIVAPLLNVHPPGHIQEAMASRSEWNVLRLRAEELRRGRSFLEFPTEAEALLLDPWVEVHKFEDRWEVRHSTHFWSQYGYNPEKAPPAFTIRPVKYGLTAGE